MLEFRFCWHCRWSEVIRVCWLKYHLRVLVISCQDIAKSVRYISNIWLQIEIWSLVYVLFCNQCAIMMERAHAACLLVLHHWCFREAICQSAFLSIRSILGKLQHFSQPCLACTMYNVQCTLYIPPLKFLPPPPPLHFSHLSHSMYSDAWFSIDYRPEGHLISFFFLQKQPD